MGGTLGKRQPSSVIVQVCEILAANEKDPDEP